MSIPEGLSLQPAGMTHAPVLAALHATSFDTPWSESAFAEMIVQVTVSGWIAVRDTPVGFILIRSAGGEAEILTLAVTPDARRGGIASALLGHALDCAAARGAQSCYLEVAEDNPNAIALYRRAGFTESGRRPGYYARGTARCDARVMRKALGPDRLHST